MRVFTNRFSLRGSQDTTTLCGGREARWRRAAATLSADLVVRGMENGDEEGRGGRC